ncbi:unnamed protein product, partial [Prorocentrum cordatum]
MRCAPPSRPSRRTPPGSSVTRRCATRCTGCSCSSADGTSKASSPAPTRRTRRSGCLRSCSAAWSSAAWAAAAPACTSWLPWPRRSRTWSRRRDFRPRRQGVRRAGPRGLGEPQQGGGARDHLDVYYAGFLDGGDLAAGSPQEARRELESFTRSYVGWAEAEAWLTDTLAPHFASGGGGAYPFDRVVQMAKEIGERYHTLNDLECRSLKVTMGELEGRAGRVRLPAFYRKGLYSHWQFDERPEYLRFVGALDESEPGSPSVILPNYLSARTNCLEASGLYALCCRNECEDLLGHLERQVGAPSAPELEVARLVAALPSDTVEAPRFLSSALLGRLSEIAASNGGLVPLHGRLFAQWTMHHAFPRECPYPHEAGTTSPQTPDEWLQRTMGETHKLSLEERQRTVDEDTCAFEPEFGPAAGCGGGGEESCPGAAPRSSWTRPPGGSGPGCCRGSSRSAARSPPCCCAAPPPLAARRGWRRGPLRRARSTRTSARRSTSSPEARRAGIQRKTRGTSRNPPEDDPCAVVSSSMHPREAPGGHRLPYSLCSRWRRPPPSTSHAASCPRRSPRGQQARLREPPSGAGRARAGRARARGATVSWPHAPGVPAGAERSARARRRG